MIAFLKNFFSISKKVLLVFIVFISVITAFLYFINKDKININQYDIVADNRRQIYKQINDPELNKSPIGKVSITLYRMTTCGLIGEACTNNPSDGNKNYQKSLFGYISKIIALPYLNQPASGVYWAYSGLTNAGFVPKAMAAEGIGFGAITPFLNLWKVFRDIAYMLLVLVLIAIGFMIMFRMKMNPQTVISVENSLPKIVITLILITFSYAIAGFLIDLMYILIIIGISLVSKADPTMNAVQVQNHYLSGGLGTIWDSFFPNGANIMTIGNALMNILPPIINTGIRLIALILVAIPLIRVLLEVAQGTGIDKALNNITIAGIGVGTLPEAGIGAPITALIVAISLGFIAVFGGGLIIGILFLVTLLFLLFRIFFMLFRSYLQMALLIVLGPIIILFEAIPGRSAFTYWFKNLLGEVLTFVTVIILMVVGGVMTKAVASSTNSWTPPLLSGFDNSIFPVLFGTGLILLIPDLVQFMKESLGIKAMPFSIGVGTFFSGAGAAAGGVMGGIGGFSSIMLAFPGLRKSLAGKLPSSIGGLISDDVNRKEGQSTLRGSVQGRNPPKAPDPTVPFTSSPE